MAYIYSKVRNTKATTLNFCQPNGLIKSEQFGMNRIYGGGWTHAIGDIAAQFGEEHQIGTPYISRISRFYCGLNVFSI